MTYAQCLDQITEWTPDSSETGNRLFNDEKIKAACFALQKQGVIVLKQCLHDEILKKLVRSFTLKREQWLETLKHSGFSTNTGCDLVRLELVGNLAHESLICNSFVIPLIASALSKKFILGSCNIELLSSGNEVLPARSIHPPLYKDWEMSGIQDQLPPFAVTLGIPLVDYCDQTSAMNIWPRVHHFSHKDREKALYSEHGVELQVRVGDCFLMDTRLPTQNLRNLGQTARGTLLITYQAPWFRDGAQPSPHSCLNLREQVFVKLPDWFKPHVSHALNKPNWLYLRYPSTIDIES